LVNVRYFTRIHAFRQGSRRVRTGRAGAAEMIFPGERIEPKVMRMFERVRMPVLDAHVDWGGMNVEQAPSRVPPVFAGEPLTIFARIANGNASEVSLLVGDRRFAVPLDLERAELGGPIPVLWAREAIRELDDETPERGSAQRRLDVDKRRNERLVGLGKRYGLLSSATSYVAVEERAPGERTQSAGELRRIPVALTKGWGDLRAEFFGAGPRARMARGGPVPPGAPAPSRAVMHAPVFYKKRKSSEADVTREALLSGAPASGGAATPSPGRPVLRRVKEFFRFGVPSETGSPSSDTTDALYDLLMTQSAAGSFAKSAALTVWLEPEAAAKLTQALPKQDEHVVVTAFVLLLLERRETARESEWRPAANKAKEWLAKQSPHFDATAMLG
jgi:Ca-activated chloride channel homolog